MGERQNAQKNRNLLEKDSIFFITKTR